MNLNQVIIAFLAPRYPAAYTEAAIAQRLNASQMLDRRCTAEDVADSLRTLQRLGMVDLQIDPTDNSAYWLTTDAGAKKWVLDGRVTVV